MRLLTILLLVPLAAWAQTETRELVGQIGSRAALLVLHASRTDQGAWQMAGEYMVLPTLQRRFLEGESSPEIGVTTLREVGDYVRIAAEDCVEQCGSQSYLEPLLIDRRGNCRLLRSDSR